MGATISVTTNGVTKRSRGTTSKVLAATGYGGLGGYGLLVNFGSQAQSPIPPPNTVVAQQPDQVAGSPVADLLAGGQNFTPGGWFGGAAGPVQSFASLAGFMGCVGGLNGFSSISAGLPWDSWIQSAGGNDSSTVLNVLYAALTAGWSNTSNPTLANTGPFAAQTAAAPLAAWSASAVLQALDNAIGQWISTS